LIVSETKRQEHDRLQRRTDELLLEHAALDRNVTPFNQANHQTGVDSASAIPLGARRVTALADQPPASARSIRFHTDRTGGRARSRSEA
jgi:hypothetical protein